MQQHYIVIMAQCTDKPIIVSELSKLAGQSGCTILNSRMDTLGREYVMMLLLGGSWDALAKVEGALPALEKRLNMTAIVKRTEPLAQTEDLLPYSVQVVALDRPGLLQKLTEFFDELGILIEQMNSDAYVASHTKTPMFSLNMTIHIPASHHLASVRERFLMFCDDHNFDAIIEPLRG